MSCLEADSVSKSLLRVKVSVVHGSLLFFFFSATDLLTKRMIVRERTQLL